MDLGLSGRGALITGSSKGIGLAAAWSLAREGCNVHLSSRTEEDLRKARDRIRSELGVSVEIHPGDLSSGDTARALVDACKDVDILVNNAGAIPAGDIHDIDEERWRKAWDRFGPEPMDPNVDHYAAALALKEHRLETMGLQRYGKMPRNGFIGECIWEDELRLTEWAARLWTLADYAFYCGTGRTTTHGMDMTWSAPG